MSTTEYMKDNKFLVSKVQVPSSIRDSIEQAISLLGGIDKAIQPGDVVTIKPNLNTGDPYPASSDPEFILALGNVLLDAGVDLLRIADSSTQRVSSRDVSNKIGLTAVAEKLGAELIHLEEHGWQKQSFPKARYMKKGHIGEPVLEPGKLVLAPCLKTHRIARFTASMKLLVGWLGKKDRLRMHARKMQQKVVDLASYFQPSLIVMDARNVFVTGGPISGKLESPNLILASGDMVSIDVEGVKLLQSYSAKNRLGGNVWDLPQIKHAVELGIGAKSDDDIIVV